MCVHLPIPSSISHHPLTLSHRAGTVTGTQTVSLEFSTLDMDDVLRSLRVVDEGGRVESISYDAATYVNFVGYPA